MRKLKKANRSRGIFQQKVNPNEAFAKAIKLSYTKDIGEAFYTANSMTDKIILDINVEGDIYKAVIVEGNSKILARIDNTVYNFPAIISAPGTRAKLIAAYAELKKRESLIMEFDSVTE